MKKKIIRPLFAATLTIILTIVPATFDQAARPPKGERIWQSVPESSVAPTANRIIVPTVYRTIRLDQAALVRLLATAPMEFSRNASQNPIIDLPMPDGTQARFRFEESPVMERSFAAKHPEIKTYRAQGIDDPTATARFDWMPNGFHALILAAPGTVLINPYAEGNTADYITYWKKDAAESAHPFVCSTNDSVLRTLLPPGFTPAVSSGTTLRTYRLALASTYEFTDTVGGGSVDGTIRAEAQIINSVNAIFERDVTIHIDMVDNEAITYAGDSKNCNDPCSGSTDPFTNGSGMTGEMATVLRSQIGASNYDFGHGFFYGSGGGSAGFVCNSDNKEAASSGLTSIEGYFVVVHEMGHQFTASHTFNANGSGSASCNGNRAHTSAYEPGGGSTIEGYGGGTCGTQSLSTSTDTFHVKNIEQIIDYTTTGGGSGCAATTSTGRSAPYAGGPGNFTIPKQTPFYLTASAIGSGITFDWEEYDLDEGLVGTNAVPNTDSDGTARPIFRVLSPSTSGTRTFPSMQYILNNANVPPNCDPMPCTSFGFLIGELLPAISRTMVFQAVVRDNHSGAGGVSTVQSTVTIDGTASPFAVTYPNSAITVSHGANLTVTWVASGNATNVKISLSTDGGATFSTVLASSTPNDGTQTVVLPSTTTSQARIKVEAVGNIYFDISDTNFTIN